MILTWDHWRAWALAPQPAELLRRLRAAGQLGLFPELDALPGVPQDPQWHPEGDVWIHTLHVCDYAALISDREDLEEPDRIVLPLVAEHLAHTQPQLSSAALRRLLKRLSPATLPQLIRLIEADVSGRPPLPQGLTPALRQFADRAVAVLQDAARDVTTATPPPLILGRHLIALGHQPGAWFREVLQTCCEAQLQGAFADEADGVAYLQRILAAKGRIRGDLP